MSDARGPLSDHESSTAAPQLSSRSPQYLVVDGGTTNTRVWAVADALVIAHERIMVGARDSAKEGSPDRLAAAVRGMLSRVSAVSAETVRDWRPRCVVGAGMITSRLGLAEVPHVGAPAGLIELAEGTRVLRMPEVTALPILLVPGVRCGSAALDEDSVSQVDLVRGEETVCIGLLRTGRIQPGGHVLTLGSHWKLLQIDASGRLATSTTTISGELLHALRTHTVLASSVAPEMPDRLDYEAVQRGVHEQRRSGLSRAAFCTRLLEAAAAGSPSSRLAFLAGIIIGDALDHWHDLLAGRAVTLIGAPALCHAWQHVLAGAGARGVVIDDAAAADATVAGLTAIAAHVDHAGRMTDDRARLDAAR